MSYSSKTVVNRPCPTCKKAGCVEIDGPLLRCSTPGCDFRLRYKCPICNVDLETTHFTEANGTWLNCPGCKSKMSVSKIKHLLENHLYVDHTQRCHICGGPTIHRKAANIGHRCFFFPQCSGQADLFGGQRETLMFIDFETTGLEIGKDCLIEVGALKIDEEGNEHTFQTFIKPIGPLPPKITEITGITPEMLENAPPLGTVIKQLIEFAGNCKIVSHNADFDIPWLVTAYLRHNLPVSAQEVICTLVWARKNQEPHCSLGALTKKYAIGHANAHRALADAAATKELFFIFENNRKSARPVKALTDYRSLSENLINRYEAYFQP